MKKLILRLRLTRELSEQNNTGNTLYAFTGDNDAGEGGTRTGKPKKGRRKKRAARKKAGKTGKSFAGKIFCIVRSQMRNKGKGAGWWITGCGKKVSSRIECAH